MSNPRVSAAEVKEIVTTTVDDNVILTNMIDTANKVINQHLLGVGHSEDILAKIELYLAAHFVALTVESGTLKGQKIGDASEWYETSSYRGPNGEGFRATRYGQQALALDSSGTLANVAGSSRKAEFRVI